MALKTHVAPTEICPHCEQAGARVLETRYSVLLKAKVRRKECSACGGRWRTQETVLCMDKRRAPAKRSPSKMRPTAWAERVPAPEIPARAIGG